MATLPVKFAAIPIKYAPKRKMIDFALPQWRNKIGEFQDADIQSWVTNLYQDKAFPTPQEFNRMYDTAISMGMMPSEMVGWRNKPMILSKEDIAAFETAHTEGAFDRAEPVKLNKMIFKMKAMLETGEKVIFVY